MTSKRQRKCQRPKTAEAIYGDDKDALLMCLIGEKVHPLTMKGINAIQKYVCHPAQKTEAITWIINGQVSNHRENQMNFM